MANMSAPDPYLVHVPGFPRVVVELYREPIDHNGEPCEPSVYYFGHPEDLIAAGVATAEMLALRRGGYPRRDAEGQPYSVRRWWRMKDGRPHQYCRVFRQVQQMDELPGVREAVENFDRLQEEYLERERLTNCKSESPRLRLVVDNSRSNQP
jgi:hypothetical protein